MNLSIFERLTLLAILPNVGDFSTLKIIRQLRENLSFDETEHKRLNFKREEKKILWDQEAVQFSDIPIGEKATDIIVDTLKKLDAEKKLADRHYSLYEKFVDT